jgi:hypothetical protein
VVPAVVPELLEGPGPEGLGEGEGEGELARPVVEGGEEVLAKKGFEGREGAAGEGPGPPC